MSIGKQDSRSVLGRYRDSLKMVLFGERSAYGFTLVISGSVLQVVNRFGQPTVPEVFVFALGSIVAFGILTAFSFGGFSTPVRSEDIRGRELPWGLIHFASVFGGLAAAYLGSEYVPRTFAFAAASGFATLAYNLLLGLEFFFAQPKERAVTEDREHP